MNRWTMIFCAALVAGTAGAAEWISMFDGRTLAGWKSNDEVANTFTVEDGVLKVSGGRCHLFYVGADGKACFTNFEFKAKVKTTPGSNSGLYFHTAFEPKGWPSQGYEAQVNTSHSDRKKTGGLYAVKDVMDNAPSKDNEWCDYGIKVEGKHIVISINGQVTSDFTEPDSWEPPKGMPGRRLSKGTIAIQGHDPKSVTYYKDLMIRPLD